MISKVRLIKLGSYCSNFLEKCPSQKISAYFNCVKPHLSIKELLATAKNHWQVRSVPMFLNTSIILVQKKQKQTNKTQYIYKEKLSPPERVSLKQFCPVGQNEICREPGRGQASRGQPDNESFSLSVGELLEHVVLGEDQVTDPLSALKALPFEEELNAHREKRQNQTLRTLQK